ncbi:MAG TPA: tRNA lysidine(34) synthetase TilS [Bacillales bacterium]|nr:tRNA lysidine(34) synthetase TilS [Bacillales bacterium]
MRQAVDRFIKRHHLLAKGSVIVVGVSGGPDSMALLDYLLSVKSKWELTLIAASADHGLRGEESATDVEFVENFCRERKIAFRRAHLDVQGYRIKHGVSVQVAARECRYHFFKQVMEEYQADCLALAHHGDDQIETMLMRQVRGSFGESLGGIPVRRSFACGEIIRPFLAIDKQEIENYCIERGLEVRRDPSNEKNQYTRNRFRHEVLPFLKSENPNVHQHFQQQSEFMNDDNQYLHDLAEARLDEVLVAKNSCEAALSVKAFLTVPMALQRRMIHLILNYLYKQIPPDLSAQHIEDVLHLLSSEQPSGRLDFPCRLQVVRSYERLIFTYVNKEQERVAYRCKVEVPGEVRIPGGLMIAEFANEFRNDPDDDDAFVCDADLVRLPLTIRTRRPGDRLPLKGMKGSKKVKAIFIDQKIGRDQREVWPVVEDADGRILWLPGLKHSGAAEPSAETEKLLVLHFRLSGNVWEDV